ncbi:MAG TPA: DUF4192 family protein [Mycobacteriales bacterium]
MTTTRARPLPLAALGLAVPAAAARLRADLHRAEQRFVADVVRTGGIGPWREQVGRRFEAAQAAAGARRLSRAETASLVVALIDRPTRDRCWLRVEHDGPASWLPLWHHLVRHALPPFRGEALFLLGWSCWRHGRDTLATAAVDALLAEEPAHRAGGMLAILLGAGVPSSSVIPLITGSAETVPAWAEGSP